MVRAAAKNHPSVAVVVDPARYADVLAAVAAGGFTLAERQRLAAAAFRHTATYDIAVASWMGNVLAPDDDTVFPAWVGASWDRADVLRYGENPHQSAPRSTGAAARARARRAAARQGDVLQQLHRHRRRLAGRARPHRPVRGDHQARQPVRIAVGTDIAAAHRKAHACDPVSAFGGVIAANREVDLTMAEQIAEVFTEVVVAPSFTDDAVAVLTREEEHPAAAAAAPAGARCGMRAGRRRPAAAGHGPDRRPRRRPARLDAGHRRPLDAAGLRRPGLRVARGAGGEVQRDPAGPRRATVGVGMGQVNRVDSARLAVARAGDRAAGSVAASDAFFPFADGLQVLLDAGVRAVVQPGGSVRDEEVDRRGRRGRRAAVPHRHPPLRALRRGPSRPSTGPPPSWPAGAERRVVEDEDFAGSTGGVPSSTG